MNAISDRSNTTPSNSGGACFCVGPQNGEPLCRCKMRSQGVYQREGQWVIPEQVIGKVQPMKCLHEELDAINPQMKGQPRNLSCPCPKCTMWC